MGTCCQPTVILPRGADAWSVERARIVLGHELAHVARHDWAAQIVAELLRAVYWFNPLVWIACRRLRQESEQACDDAVLGLGVEDPSTPPSFSNLPAPSVFTVTPGGSGARYGASVQPRMESESHAQRRFNRTPLTRPAFALVVGALLLVTLPVVSAQGGAATFSGSLMDAVGRVLPDVTLKLVSGTVNPKTGPAGQPTYEAVSDSSGHFSFTGLPAGDYTMQVAKAGFETTQGRVTLGGGQHLEQDIALQVGALMETITVTEPDPASPAAPTARKAPVTPSKSGEDPCSQVVVGGCITQPTKTFDVKPIYPADFVGTGTSTTLKLDARIGTDGLVNEVHPLSQAKPEFVAAAMDAVRQWRFTQTRLDGVPVEVRMTVMVMFAAR